MVELLYPELRRVAQFQLNARHPYSTLQPASLVNEAFMKLAQTNRLGVNDRQHFIALSARVMRQVLVDHARQKGAARRDAAQNVTLNTGVMGHPEEEIDLLALDESLKKLALHHPEGAELVELRYFGGLTIEEAAQMLGKSVATINRMWRASRAYLFLQLQEQS